MPFERRSRVLRILASFASLTSEALGVVSNFALLASNVGGAAGSSLLWGLLELLQGSIAPWRACQGSISVPTRTRSMPCIFSSAISSYKRGGSTTAAPEKRPVFLSATPVKSFAVRAKEQPIANGCNTERWCSSVRPPPQQETQTS